MYLPLAGRVRHSRTVRTIDSGIHSILCIYHFSHTPLEHVCSYIVVLDIILQQAQSSQPSLCSTVEPRLSEPHLVTANSPGVRINEVRIIEGSDNRGFTVTQACVLQTNSLPLSALFQFYRLITLNNFC